MLRIKQYMISLVISFVMAIILLSISAAIFTYTSINDIHLNSFVFGTVMISVLTGSMLLCRKVKEKGLLYGSIFGLIFCLIIYLFTALAYTGFFVSNTLGLYLAISVLSGIVGGIIGVNI